MRVSLAQAAQKLHTVLEWRALVSEWRSQEESIACVRQ